MGAYQRALVPELTLPHLFAPGLLSPEFRVDAVVLPKPFEYLLYLTSAPVPQVVKLEATESRRAL